MSGRLCVGLLLISAWPLAASAQDEPAALDASAVEREAAARLAEEEATDEVADAIAVNPVSDDEAIRERIEALLGVLAQRRGFEQIEIAVESGVVFLDGIAPSDRQRNFAGEIARNVEGVVYVDNGLTVEQLSPYSLQPAWAELSSLGADAIRVLPFLLAGALILGLGLAIGLLVRRGVRRVLRGRDYAPILKQLLANLSLLPVLLVALFLALRVTGLTRLALSVIGGTGLFGLVVGIAFRDIFENFLASLLISMNRPFTIGDLVDVDGHKGFVQTVTTRGTLLMTVEGDHIHVPNSVVYKATLRNLTSNPNRRFDFLVGIDYEDDPIAAQRSIRDALASVDAVQTDPPPSVIVEELGPSTVNLRGYYWVDIIRDNQLKARSQVVRAVKAALERDGLTMPDEQREIIFPKGVPVVMQEASTADPDNPPAAESTCLPDGRPSVDEELTPETDIIKRQAAQSNRPVGDVLLDDVSESIDETPRT